MKKKVLLSLLFIASLSPMLLNQYGGMKGVQEISGIINLTNPIGMLSLVIFVIGLFTDEWISGIGTIGMVLSELFMFFTWYTNTITPTISLQTSLDMAYPEFYLGLIVSCVVMIVYFKALEIAE